jgi:hypothetical protein
VLKRTCKCWPQTSENMPKSHNSIDIARRAVRYHRVTAAFRRSPI